MSLFVALPFQQSLQLASTALAVGGWWTRAPPAGCTSMTGRAAVNWAERQAEPRVHEIVTLGWAPHDGQVKAMLQRLAAQVQPIMQARKWRVPLLSEFFPAQANLLGLNIGGGGGACVGVAAAAAELIGNLSFSLASATEHA